MTILQPFSSCVVVTVRPSPSVTDETARAVPLLPLEEEENALADDRESPERDRTLIELDLREEVPRDADAPSGDFILISRPSGRIRNSSQLLLFETLTCRLSPGAATAARAMKAKAALVERDTTILLLMRGRRSPQRAAPLSMAQQGRVRSLATASALPAT